MIKGHVSDRLKPSKVMKDLSIYDAMTVGASGSAVCIALASFHR